MNHLGHAIVAAVAISASMMSSGHAREPASNAANPVALVDTTTAPKIEVEIVWTQVWNGQTDLFMMVSNPNDFDVYIGRCGSSRVQFVGSTEGQTMHGCGALCIYPDDFEVLRAHQRILSQLWRGCKLYPGTNRFEVTIGGASIKPLPWNYLVPGCRELKFVIMNPDTVAEVMR